LYLHLRHQHHPRGNIHTFVASQIYTNKADPMNKLMKIALVCLVAALAGAGYYYVQSQGALSAAYTNSNINMDAVAAAETCETDTGYTRLICLATALKTTLIPAQAAKVQLPYTVADAQRWSNFPPAGYGNRIGITLGELTADQLPLAKAMLQQAAGLAANEGFDEMAQILNADDYLAANTTDSAGFSSSNYHIAFLGEPAAMGTWQLYFGGHHLAFANTYTDGVLTGATPSFRGVEPFTPFDQNGRTNAPMVQEQAAFAAMIGALSPAQQTTATLPQAFSDIIVGPQNDDAFPSLREGQRVGDLTPAQQALVMAAMQTYVGDIDDADAAQLMQKYGADLAETFISFSGSVTVDQENDYVRIDGPTVWIELSMQPGRSLPGVHPHSVWRDRLTDYGGNK
jgi:Protein of unknown function (DUF3500)